MNTVLLAIIIIVCGLVVGIMAGMIGIGGGTLVIPLLNLGFGLPILSATATSLFTVLCTSCSGAIGHLRNKTTNLKLALIMAVPGLCFSPLGAILAGKASAPVLTCITAAILLIPLAQSLLSAYRQKRAKALDPAREISWSQERLDAKTVVVCILTGAVAGFCSGLVGLGGGFIIIPILSGVLKRGMHEVTATSVTFIFIVSIAGTITHALAGDIAWLYGILIAAGSIPGAFIGARLSKKIDGLYLKYILAVVLVFVCIALFVRGLG